MNIIMDMHSHTLASGHAYSTIAEMAKAAAGKGLKLLGITEHAPMMPGSCHGFYFHNLKVMPRQMFGINVMFGSELNILSEDGAMDLDDRSIENLDINIASLHPPCFAPKSKDENTRAILNAMNNPYVNVIGHCDDGRFDLDYKAIVLEAKRTDTLLELNNASLNPEGFRPRARENDEVLLGLCMKYGVPILVDSDAHVAFDVGNHTFALKVLEDLNFPEELVINTDMDKLFRYLRKKSNRSGKTEL